MQTTSVNTNQVAPSSWPGTEASGNTGTERAGVNLPAIDQMSGEELVMLLEKGLKGGDAIAGDGVFNAKGAPMLAAAVAYSASDMVDLLRLMSSKNQEVQAVTAQGSIKANMRNKEETAALQANKLQEWEKKCDEARNKSVLSKIFSWIGKIVATVASALFLVVATGLTGLTGGLGAPMIALATLALIGSSMALADQISKECGGPEISLTNMVTTMVAKTLEACGVDAEQAERIGRLAAGAVAIMVPAVLLVDPGMLGAMATSIAEMTGADANQAAMVAMVVTIATALTVGIVSGVLSGGASTAGTATKVVNAIIGGSSAIIQGSMGIAKGVNDLNVAQLQHDAEYAKAEEQKLIAICLELQGRMEEGMEELKKVMQIMDEGAQIVSQMLRGGADSIAQITANIGKRQTI